VKPPGPLILTLTVSTSTLSVTSQVIFTYSPCDADDGVACTSEISGGSVSEKTTMVSVLDSFVTPSNFRSLGVISHFHTSSKAVSSETIVALSLYPSFDCR